MLTLAALHEANIARQAAWCPDETKQPSLSFRGNELAGETGEACNVIKKLERERHGWAGSRDTLEHLGEELADVVICADLCAITAGVDLQAAVVAKFNATSEKVGLPHRLDPSLNLGALIFGFHMRDMLSDSDPVVAAGAANALAERIVAFLTKGSA
ncbi:MazG-like family protein [Brevundimonas sp.]|uniref:MazG-like family protein n=1 Tax=Brevundimonas sp. TaxID=1871086 RepID=UPI00289C8EC3|nr:MazG-like family protein [Brevundimonas sp.]